MEVTVKGTQGGKMKFTDQFDDWKVIITNGRVADTVEIILTISKDDIKRLAKAS